MRLTLFWRSPQTTLLSSGEGLEVPKVATLSLIVVISQPVTRLTEGVI